MRIIILCCFSVRFYDYSVDSLDIDVCEILKSL